MKFPRATSQPIGTEDWVIDVPFLKHVRHRVKKTFEGRAFDLQLEQIEQVLMAAEAQLNADGDIDAMVARFLSWRLPNDFAPDGGIVFNYGAGCWPTGTNLFTAAQAKAMLEHVISSQGGSK